MDLRDALRHFFHWPVRTVGFPLFSAICPTFRLTSFACCTAHRAIRSGWGGARAFVLRTCGFVLCSLCVRVLLPCWMQQKQQEKADRDARTSEAIKAHLSLYELLGVPRDADAGAIKKAFR